MVIIKVSTSCQLNISRHQNKVCAVSNTSYSDVWKYSTHHRCIWKWHHSLEKHALTVYLFLERQWTKYWQGFGTWVEKHWQSKEWNHQIEMCYWGRRGSSTGNWRGNRANTVHQLLEFGLNKFTQLSKMFSFLIKQVLSKTRIQQAKGDWIVVFTLSC